MIVTGDKMVHPALDYVGFKDVPLIPIAIICR